MEDKFLNLSIEEMCKFEKKPTKKQWNKVAKEKNLYTMKSLIFILGKPFSVIFEEVKNNKHI